MHLIARGLKSFDLDVEIAPLTLVCGPNRSGKTEVLDALAFVVLGYVPRLGRTEAVTATLMRVREIVVELHLGEGRVIVRTLTLVDDGSYRNRVRCSWVESKKDAEHQAAVLKLFGAEVRDVEELFDPGQLMRLNENQRAGRLQALLDSDTAPEDLAYATMRHTAQRLTGVADENMPEDYLALRALIDGYDPRGVAHTGQYAVLQAEAPTMLAALTSGGMTKALAWANEEKRLAHTLSLQKTQARKEFEAALGEQERAPAEPAAHERLEARRTELEQQVGAHQARAEAAEERRTAIVEAASAVSVAETELQAVTDARTEYERHGAPELARKRDELAAAEQQLAALTAPAAAAAGADVEAQATARTAEADAIAIPTVADAGAARQRFEALQKTLQGAEASPWTEVAAVAGRLEATTRQYAPSLMRYIETDLARLLELSVQGLGQNVDELRAAVAAAEGEWVRLRDEEIPRQTTARTQAQERRAALLEEARQLRERAGNARVAAAAAHDAARLAYQDRRAGLEAQCKTARAAIAALERREARTAEALRTCADALTAAEQRLRDLGPAPATVEALQEEVGTELAQVKGTLEALSAAATKRAQLAALIVEMRAAEARWRVFQALELSLQLVRDEEMVQAAAPLIEPMVRFFTAAGMTEAPYLLAGAMGWRTIQGETVPVSGLSGAEWTLFVVALNHAILTRRRPAIRLLPVEAVECQDVEPELMLTRLLRGCAALDDDGLHVLVVSPRPPIGGVPAGWTVIDTAERRRLEAAA